MSGGFILREGWVAWRRSGLAGNLAMIALAIVSAFIMLFSGFQQTVDIARDRLLGGFEIEAFLQPGRERNLDEVSTRLGNRDGVREIETITREQAAELFAERHGEDLTGLLAENPLPASVILRYDPGAISADRLAMEADEISADPDIEDVAFEGELLARFEQLSGQVLLIAGIAGAVIVLLSVLLTVQAVKVAAKTGESWARAVFLVGGSHGQVRGPLAVSGLLMGLFGGLIGVAVIGGAQWLLASSPWIATPALRAILAALALPALVGWLGAARRVRAGG
ncbi:permease-like cell division protein FtsX [bacterium]|nr:permease-like cell division protein FtsX [bacterium]